MGITVRTILHQYKQVVLTIFVLIVLSDIVFFKTESDVMLFVTLASYVGCILYYKLSSAATFRLSLLVLGVMSVAFIATGTSVITERAAVWLFFLILTGIVQQIKE